MQILGREYKVHTIDTLEDLEWWFNENFECMDGPLKAWFYIGNNKHVYKSFALGIKGTDKTKLIKAFYTSLIDWKETLPRVDEKPLLFWRCRPELQEDEQEILGPLYMTWEEWVDAGKPEIPEGYGLSENSSNFFRILGKEKVIKLYMRFCIPEVEGPNLYFKPEGYPTLILNNGI